KLQHTKSRKYFSMSNSKKVHIALNVSDVNRSVAFYRAMFGADPVKRKPGYAKFSIDEPALNLTLNYEGEISERGALNHLGVAVENSTQVLAAKKRLAEAGLATRDELNGDCCFALQDKGWVTDPHGYRWERFTVQAGDTKPGLHAGVTRTHTADQSC